MSQRLSSPAVRIRKAAPGDLVALLALENSAFVTDRMSARQLRRHLASASAECLVAVGDRGVLGAALLFLRRGSKVARLYSIAVADAARGTGLGARLLEAAERRAREREARVLRLEVRGDNDAARRLYERHHYRRIATLPGYYEDGADGIRYERELRPQRLA
jgi:ribosomal protein S18 acetylase RimI-like enzyme